MLAGVSIQSALSQGKSPLRHLPVAKVSSLVARRPQQSLHEPDCQTLCLTPAKIHTAGSLREDLGDSWLFFLMPVVLPLARLSRWLAVSDRPRCERLEKQTAGRDATALCDWDLSGGSLRNGESWRHQARASRRISLFRRSSAVRRARSSSP